MTVTYRMRASSGLYTSILSAGETASVAPHGGCPRSALSRRCARGPALDPRRKNSRQALLSARRMELRRVSAYGSNRGCDWRRAALSAPPPLSHRSIDSDEPKNRSISVFRNEIDPGSTYGTDVVVRSVVNRLWCSAESTAWPTVTWTVLILRPRTSRTTPSTTSVRRWRRRSRQASAE